MEDVGVHEEKYHQSLLYLKNTWSKKRNALRKKWDIVVILRRLGAMGEMHAGVMSYAATGIDMKIPG